MPSYETAVTVTRAKVLIPQKPLPFLIENISPITIANAGGKIATNSFWGYSRAGVPDVRNGDLLTDLNGVQYRVEGIPETADMSFMRVMLSKFMSKTP